ncbi:hypothetical protein [Streptomyces ureilyticus]|uniref:Uncharacterized protein n=1 Tax=Streptomyces ureilyticus TaxID=1775131 RepID=A0ABX0DTI7_9ACTN|nr:hypothetical protein [Streptomyces ureilyticus]NGO45201.1 hypothetical protein [Streptomyces ureilyticus]
MASDEYVCPVCGQPVEQVVRRHKTLGVFVPLWRPGPCKNPECQAYEAEEGESEPVLTSESGPVPEKVEKTEQRDS